MQPKWSITISAKDFLRANPVRDLTRSYELSRLRFPRRDNGNSSYSPDTKDQPNSSLPKVDLNKAAEQNTSASSPPEEKKETCGIISQWTGKPLCSPQTGKPMCGPGGGPLVGPSGDLIRSQWS